jgi:hypothetical protein
MAFLGMDEVGKFQRVAHEEDRRVVSNDVSVVFLGVEAQRSMVDTPRRSAPARY